MSSETPSRRASLPTLTVTRRSSNCWRMEPTESRSAPGCCRLWKIGLAARTSSLPDPVNDLRFGGQLLAPSGIIVGRFEAARQSPQGTLEPPPCLKPPPRRGQTFDKARLGASPIRISAHPASSQPMLRIPCFSSLKAVFSDFYPLNSRNIPQKHAPYVGPTRRYRSEEHTSELQSLRHLVCRLLL